MLFVLGAVGIVSGGAYGIWRLPLRKGESCDRTAAMQHARALHAAEDAEGTARFCDDFIQRCGKYPPLRLLSYQAHRRLGAFDLAVRDATELIDSDPRNAISWSWRANAHQSRGAPEQALVDFREAFRLQPDQFVIARQLATALEQLHQPCEAVQVLKAHRRVQYAKPLPAEAVEQIARLEAEGACGSAVNGARMLPGGP